MAKAKKNTTEKQKVQTILQGIVVSQSSLQTARVRVEIKRPHPLYKKIMASHKIYLVHVPEGMEVKEGDVVEIVPSRPISKQKRWIINNIVETAE